MKKVQLEEFLESFIGSEGSYPFGPEALMFKVAGKMFALISHNDKAPILTLKCDPTDAIILVSQFDSISPGYHMNKKHWITIQLTGEIEDAMIRDLAESSYKLVISKLKKSEKLQLDAASTCI